MMHHFPVIDAGKLGEGFIEAHHLKQIAELRGKVIELNPKQDFCVLCSNCHSMIHKYANPGDVAGFKKLLILKSKRLD
jgi:5-methylcytosine-specific restriction protein A